MHDDFSIIVAVDKKRGIGKNGKLPWNLKGDMRWFREKTISHGKENIVIMGRKTYLSLPKNFRPLPKRINIILSKTLKNPYEKCSVVNDFNALFSDGHSLLKKNDNEVFVIGGEKIYKQAIHHPACKKIYLPKINKDFGCDTFFPPYETLFRETKIIAQKHEGTLTYSVHLYERTQENNSK